MLKRELKKQLYTRWDEITLMLVVEAGFFLFGELMLAAAVYGIGGIERTVIPIGTMLAACVPVILMVFFGMSSLAMNFNLAVSMGSVAAGMLWRCLAFRICRQLRFYGSRICFMHWNNGSFALLMRG